MEELRIIPAIFVLYCFGYHCRAIWRLYQTRIAGTTGVTLGETWLKYWRSPCVLRSALRCATRSLAVFVGIEIAEDEKPPDKES
jgi:hypothetical protein